MRSTRSAFVGLLAVLLASPLVLAQPVQSYWWMPAQGEPSPEFGPDVPASPLPKYSVAAFNDEVWSFTAGKHHHTIAVPTGWTRVVMVYRQNPTGDPWDRLFQAFFENVEVLRGAAPRSDMTITKDMTRYASLLPQGGTADIAVDTSEWTGGAQHVWVTLNFYGDATGCRVDASPSPAAACGDGVTSALVEPAAGRVVRAFDSAGLCQDSVLDVPVTFPNATSSKGTLEFFATNHGREEGYVTSRHFDIFVDGTPLTTVYTFPYRYAWVGFGSPRPYNDQVIHEAMWWSQFQALDILGVHTGVGEIPPYRLQLDSSQLALLSGGPHTIEVRAGGLYNCVWITSLAFLLDT